MQGTGKITYPDGSIYEGQMAADQPDGTGKITYPDGATYEGDWQAG